MVTKKVKATYSRACPKCRKYVTANKGRVRCPVCKSKLTGGYVRN
jgi:Zn finger protein HypA/HybF involved in hydrogenase expression